jgi:hypothetical protein
MSLLAGLDFVVDKSAWHKSRFVETEVSTDLAPGQVLLRVDRFAFTANNITYAMAGEMLRYWYNDQIGALATEPSVYIDMAGNTKVTRTVHDRLGENLKYSQRIGGTHWDAGGGDDDLPGPAREFFFAPAQSQKRIADWGPAGFQERLGASWKEFQDASSSWLRIERAYGRAALERVYQATLEGSASPAQGNVVSLWESADAR